MNTNQNCDHAKDMLLEEIQDGMTKDGFDIFLSKHEECSDELRSIYSVWGDLDNLRTPEPSNSMDEGFYAKLAAEPGQKLTIVKKPNWIRNIAVAASIFMVGALAGFYLLQSGINDGPMANVVKADENIVYASNSLNRLEDISEMSKATELTDKIIDALNQALLNDSNVNVRLTAIEAMLQYADNPRVRENLIKAIPYQDSPIIQLTLAEVMIALEEENSKDEWEELFKSDNLEADVKMQLEETLAPVLKL